MSTIPSSSPPPLNSSFSQSPTESSWNQKFEQVAQKALEELSVALLLNACCLPFVEEKDRKFLLTIPIAGILANAGIRLFANGSQATITKVCSASFAFFGMLNPMIVIHEAGHFLASLLLFVPLLGPPVLSLLPFGSVPFSQSPFLANGYGGAILHYPPRESSLSTLGKTIGLTPSLVIGSLAGPMAQWITSFCLMTEATHAKHSGHKEFGQYLFSAAILNIGIAGLAMGISLIREADYSCLSKDSELPFVATAIGLATLSYHLIRKYCRAVPA